MPLSDTTVDLRTPTGERWIQVVMESWLSYYSITSIEVDDAMISDVVILVDTFGVLMGIPERHTCLSPQDAETLAKVIRDMLLARSFMQNDRAALKVVKELVLAILTPDLVRGLDEDAVGLMAEKSIRKLGETLADETYEFVEFPPSVEDLIEVCTYEALSEVLESFGKELPPSVEQELQNKARTVQDIMTVFRQERIKEDRLWHLFNAGMYCDCIKRSFLTLKPKQSLLLALCYYDNQRIPDSDVLEVLLDSGRRYTQRGSTIGQGNIDRNLHDILRRVLPSRLAREFAMSMEHFLDTAQKGHSADTTEPAIRTYISNSSSSPCVDSDKLLEFCQRGTGVKKTSLMSSEILRMCRLLSKKSING